MKFLVLYKITQYVIYISAVSDNIYSHILVMCNTHSMKYNITGNKCEFYYCIFETLYLARYSLVFYKSLQMKNCDCNWISMQTYYNFHYIQFPFFTIISSWRLFWHHICRYFAMCRRFRRAFGVRVYDYIV